LRLHSRAGKKDAQHLGAHVLLRYEHDSTPPI